MKIYLSARYGRAEEMRQLARQLRAAGHEITSRWIWPASAELTDPDHPRAGQWAAEDLADIAEAHIVIHFAEPAGAPGADSGGRFVELGYAIGLGVPCVVIGAGDCIFYRLPQVRRFANAAYLQAAINIATLPAPGCLSNPAPKPISHVPGAGAVCPD